MAPNRTAMKWTYSIEQKLKAAILLGLVFALVFVKNRMDSNNVAELGSSFSSVFEDRLVVERYIYQISSQLYQKKILLDQCVGTDDLDDAVEELASRNAQIETLLLAYEQTHFTSEEEVLFDSLKESLSEINRIERHYLAGGNLFDSSLQETFAVATAHLNGLSDIQVEVGRSMTDHSKKLVASNVMLTHFELVLLVLIGLIIQALVFASRSVVPKFPHVGGMN
jgi:hypothetical protein